MSQGTLTEPGPQHLRSGARTLAAKGKHLKHKSLHGAPGEILPASDRETSRGQVLAEY